MSDQSDDDVGGFLIILGMLGLVGLFAWLCLKLNWPMYFGGSVVLFVFVALVLVVGFLPSSEPVVILSQLPDDLREPLMPFVRRGTQQLTVSQIRRFYRAAGELMEERADLARHQADLINASSALQLASAMADFVRDLSSEDRALLQIEQQRR